MDKELLALLNSARASGASESQMQGIIDAYRQKKNGGANGTEQSVDVLTEPAPSISQSSVDTKSKSGIALFDEPIEVGKNIGDFNKAFEDATGYKKFDLAEPTTIGLKGLLSDSDEKFEERKFKTYSKEKEKIDAVSRKIYFGEIKAQELSALQKNPFGRKIANDIIRQYVPEVTDDIIEAPETIEVTAKKIKEKNRVNFFNVEKKAISKSDNDVAVTIAELNKITPESDEQLDITDFNNNDQLSNAIEKVSRLQQLEQGGYSSLSDDEKKSAKEKTGILLSKLNNRLFYNIGQYGVPESVTKFNDQIEQSVLGKVMESEQGEAVYEGTNKDKDKVQQFKLGLAALEKSDPVLFKNVTEAIAEKKQIADSDFSNIALVGQQIDNSQRYRAAAFIPELIDTETTFEYGTKGQKVALVSARIGEWMKDNGHSNEPEFSEKLIRQAAKELKIDNPEIINTIVFNEKLKGYDQIPKTGALENVIAGFMQPFQGIVSTINVLGESPAETYLRSKSLQPTTGTQETQDELGNVSDILPSERGEFTTEMFRGLGQFIPQVLLTKGVGGVLRGTATGLSSFATSAKTAKNIADIGGTFVSTYIQTYGTAYEDHLQKTGDVDKSNFMAKINAATAAGFEGLILPDVRIFDKAISGLRSGLASDLVDLVKKGADPADIAKKARPFIEKFVVNTASILGQETSEEVGTGFVDFITEAIFDNKNVRDRNLGKELWDVTKSTFAAMMLPAILGGGGTSLQKDFTTKSLHAAAINSDSYKESLQNSLDKEYISKEEYNNSIKIINTHQQSLASVPEINSNGEKLTPQQKLDFAYEQTKIKVYEDKAGQAKSTVEKKMWDDKIKQAEKVQEEILIPKTEIQSPTKTIQDENVQEGLQAETQIQEEVIKEEVLDEAPLIDVLKNVKLEGIELKYKDVEFDDPVFSETRKMRAQKAKSELEGRYDILTELVNCLT